MIRTLFLMTALLLVHGAECKVRLTTLSHIPTADLLGHNQFAIGSHSNFFVYSTSDTADKPAFWVMPVAGVDAGFFNRLEVGVRYAGGVSLQFKGLVLDEERFGYSPAVTVGTRDIMWSSEAYFFGMRRADTAEAMTNNAFIALGKTIEPYGLRLQAGVLSNFRFDSERFSPFGGAELYVGAGTYMGYEMFWRFGAPRHFFNASYMYGKKLILTLGLSELSSVFSQGGKSGFYLFSKEALKTSGYGAPGITFSITFSGSFMRGAEGLKGQSDDIKDLQKEIQALKMRQAELETRIQGAESHAQEIEEDMTLFTSRAPQEMKKNYDLVISEHLKVLQDMVSGEGEFDPEKAADHVRKIVEYKELALPSLDKILKNPKANPKLTSLAIQMIGQIGNKKSRIMLVRLLDSRETNIKIDAIIAMGNLNDKSVVPDLERALYDTDEAVVMAAREVIFKLTGFRKELKPKDVPPPPPAPIEEDSSAADEEGH